MDDYKVGYRKPPRDTRFKPGVCPNPKGRGKRNEFSPAEGIREFFDEKVSYQENGVRKTSTRAEFTVRWLIRSALAGNARDAAEILELRKHAQSTDISTGPLVLRIKGGLPKEYGYSDHMRIVGDR